MNSSGCKFCDGSDPTLIENHDPMCHKCLASAEESFIALLCGRVIQFEHFTKRADELKYLGDVLRLLGKAKAAVRRTNNIKPAKPGDPSRNPSGRGGSNGNGD